jgi:extradiol dioxygenase family protein
MNHQAVEQGDALLDNTPATMGRYIAHVAVPCRDLDEAARWYTDVFGAQLMRTLKDRVTFSFGGVLQLVCHLERRAVASDPRAYPRHHGLTLLRKEDFLRMRDHLVNLGVKFVVPPAVRFANTPNEHHTLMVADPSGNVVELKWYLRPEGAY